MQAVKKVAKKTGARPKLVPKPVVKIEFSPKLHNAIRYEVLSYGAQSGFEEIVADGLTGENSAEWDKLVEAHGWDNVTKAVKKGRWA